MARMHDVALEVKTNILAAKRLREKPDRERRK